MPVSGRINVDVEFTDSAESGITKNTKRLVLQGADSYSTGKVALFSGVCGTAVLNFNLFAATTYKDSTGAAVSFSQASRIAFSASPLAYFDTGSYSGDDNALASRSNEAVVVDGRDTGSVNVYTTSGTASYTLIIYGT